MPDIPLVRCEGKSFADGSELTADKFVAGAALLRSAKSATTRATEAAYALGDCLYFYAGHACPGFGDVVLVYEGDAFDALPGGDATPVDTGGVRAERVHAKKWEGLTKADSDAQRAAFIAAARVALSAWRKACSAYVATYFDSVGDYVLGGRPKQDDELGRMLHPSNERRAWTWEIRGHADHPLTQQLKRAWVSSDFYEAVRQRFMDGAAAWPFSQFADMVKPSPPGATPHLSAEKELAAWLA